MIWFIYVFKRLYWLYGLIEGIVSDKSSSRWRVVNRRMIGLFESFSEEWIIRELGDKSRSREDIKL